MGGKDGGNSDGEGFVLGFPFDQLLDQRCGLEPASAKKRGRGLRWPTKGCAGSGNVVICGPPGSGKSTLALQWAVACAARDENRSVTAYISLENTPDEVVEKARAFGWAGHLRKHQNLHHANELSTAHDYRKLLLRVLTQPKLGEGPNCPMIETQTDSSKTARWCNLHERHMCKYDDAAELNDSEKADLLPGTCRGVLLTTLAPRPISGDASDDFFWRRYRQLERLLSAGRLLNDNLCVAGNAKGLKSILKLVVIDSLPMFSSRSITAEEMSHLFALFQKYGTIGVFVVESTRETPFDSTMADVVVSLQMTKEKGYAVRYFEIEKSRFGNKVNGPHPFKTRPRRGVVVYPSLHYIVGETRSGMKRCAYEVEKMWWSEAMREMLPGNLKRGSVVTIEGPRGSYKTNLALTFLAHGLWEAENVLLIHLHDRQMLAEQRKELRVSLEADNEGFHWGRLKLKRSLRAGWPEPIAEKKAQIETWQYTHGKGKQKKVGNLFEVDFKTGFLLAEEFVHVVREILIRQRMKRRPIKRVVLSNISEIGAAYPFLRDSHTSGDIFIAAFAHFMRNHGVDLVIVGNSEGLEESRDAVDRACSVSDAIVSTRFCDVFGDRYVLIQGERPTTSGARNKGEGDQEYVPGVIIESSNGYTIDMKRLQGLVGFGSGHIKRPALTFHTFEEMDIHRQYNDTLRKMLVSASEQPFDSDLSQISKKDSGFQVDRFMTRDIKAMLDGLSMLDGKPISRTVVSTIDEVYWNELNPKKGDKLNPKKEDKLTPKKECLSTVNDTLRSKRRECYRGNAGDQRLVPYYGNVLLLAYRTKDDRNKIIRGIVGLQKKHLVGLSGKENKMFRRARSWVDVRNLAKSIHDKLANAPSVPLLDYYRYAGETLASALVDALACGWGLTPEINPAEEKKRPGRLAKALRVGRRASKKVIVDLQALGKLLSPIEKPRPALRTDEDHVKEYEDLSPDAPVYLCWYSQLRELIARHPELAGKLRVCALPGGGTRGDWFLGVAKGSVSRDLGQQFVKQLTDEREEFNRLIRGVGLPTLEKFYSDKDCHKAWLGSEIPLRAIGAIHSHAISRGDLTWKDRNSYPSYWYYLYTICRRLMKPISGEEVKAILQRMPAQIKELSERIEQPLQS